MERGTKIDRAGERPSRRFIRGALVTLVFCIVLVGLASSASAADLSRSLTLASDPYDDHVRPEVQSAYGAHRIPLDSFLRRSVKSAVPLVMAYPSSYDLRAQGKLTPIKDQNPHGTCWSFATYGSLESCLMPGETWDFSENNLVWFAGWDWEPYDGGGVYEESTAYLARWDGPVLESADPYMSSTHPDPDTLTKQKHVQEVLILASKQGTSFDDIKAAIMNHGAVATYMYAAGIDTYWDAATSSYYYPASGSEDSDHAVCIVGWDDAYPASNFDTTPPGNGAFIVRNSWGTTFGDAGYFYASYYDKWIGVDGWCYSGAEANDNYGDIYDYDPLGCIDYTGFTDVTTMWDANVFTARRAESVTAAGVYTAYAGVSYEVWAGGTLQTMTQRGSGVFANAGYHTADMTTPLAVSSGQQFAVAFKLTAGAGQIYLAPLEYRYEGLTSDASASAGQSYVSADGSTWYDLVTDLDPTANVCVKAFTGGSTPPPDPVLSAVTPNHGKATDTVVLTGTNLGTSGTVYFGATSATTSSWASTAIVATVPAGSGTVNVTVSTGGKTSNAVSFTYDSVTPDPVLTSLIPNSGAPGSGVVITGTNLGTSGTVYFGATSATTSSWAPTAIVATVPNGLPAGPVNVTVSTGGKTSNALPYTVLTNGGSAPTMSFSCPHDLARWHNHDLPVTFTITDADGDADVLLYSGDQSTWYEMDLAVYDTLNFPAEADHSWDGDTEVFCKVRDLALHESPVQSFHVKIDTRKPTAKALYAVTVRKGRAATLKYKIVDAAPNGGTATGVKVVVKNRSGRTVKTFRLGTRQVNKTYSLRFTCKLAKGSYRWYVSGKDVAGNAARVGSNRLTVK